MMSGSSSSVSDWLGSASRQKIQIWCEDPEASSEKIAGGVIEKTYLTYKLLMKQPGRDISGIVRHRYSEFEALRSNLRDRYTVFGILVPNLPPKSVMNTLLSSKRADPFIKERTLGLTLFCEAIVSSPWFRNDSSWKLFVKSSSAKMESTDDENVSETMLMSALANLPSQDITMKEKYDTFKGEIYSAEKQVRNFLDKVRAVQQCQRAMQAANDNLRQSLHDWNQVENTFTQISAEKKGGNLSEMLPSHWSVSSTLYSTANLLDKMASCESSLPTYLGLILATALELELANIESMKELFRFYDEVVHSCESLTNKLYKAENNPKIKEDVIINLKQNLTEKKACKNIFSKGFVHFTMPLFTKQRAERLRKATASLATVFFTTSSSIQKSSTDFFEVMKINPADIITEICKSLELLSLKPLELPPFIPEIGSTEGTKLHEADPVFDLYNYAQDQADEVLEDTVIRKDFDHRQSSDAAKESAGPTTSNSDSEKRKSKGLGFNFSSLRRGRKSDPPAPTLTIGGASVTPPPEQLDPRETFDYTKNHVETIDINGSDSSIVTSKASPNAEYTSLGSSSPPPYSIVPAISAIPTFNKNEKSLNLLSELTGGEEKPKFTSFRDSEFEN